MKWTQITIETTSEGLEPLCDKLTMLCDDGFACVSGEEFLAFAAENTDKWDYIDDELLNEIRDKNMVKVFVSPDDDKDERLSQLKTGMEELRKDRSDIDFGPLTPMPSEIFDEDFMNSWKKYYKPIKISDKFSVVPKWEEYTPSEGETVIRMDPGLAFGTGSHATTRLCLELIEKYLTDGTRILDVGCGSGILSIGAMKLGARSARAIDIDDVAVKAAGENAADNGFFPPEYTAVCADLLSQTDEKFDLVAANIVADVIKTLSGDVGEVMEESGIFIASGIIEERSEEVKTAIENAGFAIFEERHSNGWAAFASKKGKAVSDF